LSQLPCGFGFAETELITWEMIGAAAVAMATGPCACTALPEIASTAAGAIKAAKILYFIIE
jgi:hypothetical protein